MTTQKAFSCCKLIITCLFSLLITLFCPLFSDIHAKDEEKRVEVSSFDEFASSLNQMQSTGGTIVLTQDITVLTESIILIIMQGIAKRLLLKPADIQFM